MRLITLNCWGGKVFEPLMEFFGRNAETTDIFCLQEVLFGTEAKLNVHDTRNNLFEELKTVLPNFQSFTRLSPPGSLFAGLDPHVPTGQAIFVREGISVTEHGGFDTYDAESPIARDKSITTTGHVQFIKIATSRQDLLICNLHGLWQREGKVDTPYRFRQSEIILHFLKSRTGPLILSGDFNMLPRMESYRILSKDMYDHITKNAITTTRSPLYTRITKAPHSDYTLSSPEVTTNGFQVLPDVVSDHLPLVLDFEA